VGFPEPISVLISCESGIAAGLDYNVSVSSRESEKKAAERHQRHAVYASEATGLLVIAFLLLVLTLVRYWQSIHWSLR
jgi:uncharacterized membrane protein YdfJ with MMPL/SSD domain